MRRRENKVEKFLNDFEKLIKKHKISKVESQEIIEVIKHKLLETEREKIELYIE